MDIEFVVNACVCVINKFSDVAPLQEFEVLAYEQACRTLETILKDFRETWETNDELENFTR